MRVLLTCVCLYLSCLYFPGEGAYKDVDENCRSHLTKFDPHMNTYIGQVYDLEATHDTGDKYRYQVGVCTDVGSTSRYEGCGAMQFGIADSNLTHCLGKVTSAQVARSPAGRRGHVQLTCTITQTPTCGIQGLAGGAVNTSDGAWIELTYSQGSHYGSHCGRTARTARLVFLCDPYITGHGNLEFLEENNGDSLCYYLFSLSARSVCGFPGNLTPGDIILIICVALVVVWFVVMAIGMAFKRFIVGAKGWEQIPFLDFYKAFGNLEADGCDLVCRTRSSRVVEYKEPTFGADTDDEDEDKDDNLLPM